MIYLHQYPAIWGLPSLSPFCIKVEMYLRKNKIPYRVVIEKNPARGPKGKMPFIRDGEHVIPDSTFILQHLAEKRGLQSSAGALQEAQGIAIQRMVEEHLYFILLYSRWIDPKGWSILKTEFAPLFPPLIGVPFLIFLRSRLRSQAYQQGLGRHTQEEVYRLGSQEMKALSDLLGDKTYFLGTQFSEVDATVYAFLITILKQPIESHLKKTLLTHPNLVAYCLREEAECFPDYVNREKVTP
ncbi:glutathione S-transferase family protein [Bdellovibrio bacteriovorus]|uniref:glutathione S-transferase family protein n=1 Tax=Bdellovibrio TaxID=958 RepID=UPI0035A8DEBE